MDLGEEVPEIFNVFFDVVVGLGVLIGDPLRYARFQVALGYLQQCMRFRTIALECGASPSRNFEHRCVLTQGMDQDGGRIGIARVHQGTLKQLVTVPSSSCA